MIDFRYHLVSIVAIFLALGLGIVLGSTALQGPVLSALEKTSSSQRTQIDQLYATEYQLQQQLAAGDRFAQDAEPQLVRGLLAGQRVVLIEAPGAPSGVIDGVTGAAQQAGASITGQIQLQTKFFDASASTQQALGQLAESLAPAGTSLRQGSALAQASQVLAGAILTRTAPGSPPAGQRDPVDKAVLNGFGAGGFLSGAPAARATLAVVVAPGAPPSTNNSNAASQALVTLAQQLEPAGQGTVVAGTITGSGPGSAINVMRTGGRSGRLSSVDNADTVTGQIVVVWALAEQQRGVAGNYGSAATATAPGPSPAPTPSASPSASAQLGKTSARAASSGHSRSPSPAASRGASITGGGG